LKPVESNASPRVQLIHWFQTFWMICLVVPLCVGSTVGENIFTATIAWDVAVLPSHVSITKDMYNFLKVQWIGMRCIYQHVKFSTPYSVIRKKTNPVCGW
jgi:hypothetical protein